MFPRVLFSFCVLALTWLACSGQEAQHWTERRNQGFEGPVRSVLTTVVRPNPDPRPAAGRKLAVQGNADWAVFDVRGRLIEFASASSGDDLKAISKCTFQGDGNKVCEDSTGQHQVTRQQEKTLTDRGRESAFFTGSKMETRDVTHFDAKGRAVATRSYHGDGRLIAESSTLFNNDGETSTWKVYDESGHVVLNQRTLATKDEGRYDRWSYDAEGNLVWHLALNHDGELLSYWYRVGYTSNTGTSDSLGICRPRVCVWYKFDEQGSGRMEKSVRRTSGESHLEPDNEEHYNFDGALDEKAEIKYVRDTHGNWTSRSVFVWAPASNQMIEVERDSRTIEYY